MLQKTPISINFGKGLDTKTDPFQVTLGNFLELENSVFTTGNRLQKRNGFGALLPLPDATSTYLTTFNNALVAIDNDIRTLSESSNQWLNKGKLQPIQLSVLPLIRNSTNQSQSDSVTADNGLVCTVFTDDVPSGSSTVPIYKFAINDSVTGQSVVAPTVITAPSGTVEGPARVFLLRNYFILVFSVLIAGVHHLQYIAINNSVPGQVNLAVDLSAQYTPSATTAFDGVVANNTLYLAWNGNDGGGAVRMTSLTSTLQQSNTVTYSGHAGTLFSVTADATTGTPVVYTTFYDSATNNAYTLAVNAALVTVSAPTLVIAGTLVSALTSAAQNGVLTFFYEVTNAYAYDSAVPTHFLRRNTITQAGTVGTSSIIVRSLGIGSKAFIIDGVIYLLATYQSTFQPSYFMINSAGKVIGKLAYQNGGGYITKTLPSATISGNVVSISYQIKDLIQAVNKNQGVPNVAGVYSQTGINLAKWTFDTTAVSTSEIGNNLNVSGGIVWMYDGFQATEQNFNLYPEDLEATTAGTGGGLAAQKYFYVGVYEWSDNQGNVFRSAGSVPLQVDLTSVTMTPITFTSVFAANTSSIVVSSATGLRVGQILTDSTTGPNILAGTYITSINGTTIGLSLPTARASAGGGDTLATSNVGTATINFPTLKITYKTSTPVNLVLYRWSTAQQVYYQTTSIVLPLQNDTTVDYVTFVDKNADAAIQGNNILYTTGGVVENIGPPSAAIVTLFKSRLFLLDSEDRNLLWYSKQVIKATPVEMSDLFTLFVAPTVSAQGSTGDITAMAALDDKLILFKKDAIYYITGNGPDNTGANNDFSDPVFISSVVGCANQNSIVFTPNGLIFQSDKGLWALGRDLSTQYIGAPVERYNTDVVKAAINVPGTNQVRFTLASGVTLMYDYFYAQWGTFTNIPAISITLYNGLHTYLNASGAVFQETPGKYLDASNPVLMSFQTSWLNLAGLQGFERIYFFYLLGTFITPHKISLQMAFDYNSAPSQSVTINPGLYNPPYGSDPLYGSSTPYGGNGTVEQWRIFISQQKCQAMQINFKEFYDSSYGLAASAGAGLTLSGLNVVAGMKKGYPTLRPSRSIG